MCDRSRLCNAKKQDVCWSRFGYGWLASLLLWLLTDVEGQGFRGWGCMCVKISVNQAWLSLHAVETCWQHSQVHLHISSLLVSTFLPPFSMKRPSLLLSQQTLCFRCPASVSTRPEGSWNKEEGCFVHSFDVINNIRIDLNVSVLLYQVFFFLLGAMLKIENCGVEKMRNSL